MIAGVGHNSIGPRAISTLAPRRQEQASDTQFAPRVQAANDNGIHFVLPTQKVALSNVTGPSLALSSVDFATIFNHVAPVISAQNFDFASASYGFSKLLGASSLQLFA